MSNRCNFDKLFMVQDEIVDGESRTKLLWGFFRWCNWTIFHSFGIHFIILSIKNARNGQFEAFIFWSVFIGWAPQIFVRI